MENQEKMSVVKTISVLDMLGGGGNKIQFFIVGYVIFLKIS